MPEARLQRTRATLPNGYQFGDMGRYVDEARRYEDFMGKLRRLDAELWIRSRSHGWNDIERGEH